MDEAACNYSPDATDDDGSCFFALACEDCEGNCDPGATTDGDGICDCAPIVGCTDLTACNYNAEAVDEDGSCLYAEAGQDCFGNCLLDGDGDGICDDVDPCIGVLDSCGVCNGPGPLLACGCSPVPAGDCDCDGSQLDAVGVCGGDCSADENANGICDDLESGLCGVGTYWDEASVQCLAEEVDCIADLNGDGLIQINDLLILLGFIGYYCSDL